MKELRKGSKREIKRVAYLIAAELLKAEQDSLGDLLGMYEEAGINPDYESVWDSIDEIIQGLEKRGGIG